MGQPGYYPNAKLRCRVQKRFELIPEISFSLLGKIGSVTAAAKHILNHQVVAGKVYQAILGLNHQQQKAAKINFPA
jgi:hypothetical protein